MKILVAEDDPASRELLCALLEEEDYQVIEAADGREALDKLNEMTPDLALLDIQMPHLDGFEVLSRMRQDPRLANLPVIAVTAFAMRGDDERCLGAGFDAYVSKPIETRSLQALIRRFLDSARL
jgi:CheY-like chemotaxis protein